MPSTEMVVMVAVVSALALSFIALLRLLSTFIVHKTIRKAVETNPQQVDSLLAKLTAPPETSGEDKTAIVLIAIGLAMVGAPLIAVDDPGVIRLAIGAALFPLLVGGALWLRWRAVERARARERTQ